MIPIKNIYWMLAYAFSALRSKGYASLASEEFENASALLSAILARGINNQAKQGLKRDYTEITETTYSPKGKIDVSESVKTNSIIKHSLVCTHDEFSLDSHLNRVIKCAGKVLLRSDATPERKKDLRRAMRHLDLVTDIDPKDIAWSYRFDKNCATYRMLISICKLVIDGEIHSQKSGSMRLEAFDEKRLHALFEKFVLAYYKREHSEAVKAHAPLIDWALDDDYANMLPVMRSDITLESIGEGRKDVLIIDTKFYANALAVRGDFGSVTNRSANLYQIFSYVKNKEEQLCRDGQEHKVSGMLLYARTSESVQPNNVYQMSGNQVSVKTLDLNVEFSEVRKQLDEIVWSHFG